MSETPWLVRRLQANQADKPSIVGLEADPLVTSLGDPIRELPGDQPNESEGSE